MKRWFIHIFLFLLLGAIVNVAVAWGCALWSMDQAAYWESPNAMVGFETPPLQVDPPGPWILAKDARSVGLHLQTYERINVASALDDFVHYAKIGNAEHARVWGEVATTYGSSEELREYLIDDGKVRRLQEAFARAELIPSIQTTVNALQARIESVSPIAAAGLGDEPPPAPDRIDTLLVVDAGWPFKTMGGAEAARMSFAAPVYMRMMNATRVSMLASNGPSGQPRLLPFGPIWHGFAINTVFYALGGWLLFAGPFVLRRWRRIKRGLCPKCAYDLRGRRTDDADVCPECGASM